VRLQISLFIGITTQQSHFMTRPVASVDSSSVFLTKNPRDYAEFLATIWKPSLVHVFPALRLLYVYWLVVLISSLDCLCNLLLDRVIDLSVLWTIVVYFNQCLLLCWFCSSRDIISDSNGVSNNYNKKQNLGIETPFHIVWFWVQFGENSHPYKKDGGACRTF